MTQIKFFIGTNLQSLEDEINKFIKSHTFISSSITYANSQFIITVYYSQAIM